MKRFSLIFLLLWCITVGAQSERIPHLWTEGGKIELLNQSVEVNVVGKVADIRLLQSFKVSDAHSGGYLFPINLETSLYELTVFYPDKIFSLDSKNMSNIRKQVIAENKKRRNITLSQSTEPGFLRLELPDIPNGEEIIVSLKYTQDIDNNIEIRNLTLPSFASKSYQNLLEVFSFKINIISPTQIFESEILNYDAQKQQISNKYNVFEYRGSEFKKPIVLKYRTRGDDADAGMLVYEEWGCRYILGIVEPPQFIKPEEIAPREYIFVMDVSGSMNGFPIETSKELIIRILNDLKPNEKFNILFFAGSSDFLAEESVYATPENKEYAIESINSHRGKGMTKLDDALQKVYKDKPDPEYNRIVVIVTDGLFGGTGPLYANLRNNLDDAQYFVFGIGYDIGRLTLQRMAGIVGTEAVLITERADAKKELNRFFNLINRPLLRHIEVSSGNLNLRETYPSNFNGFLSSHSSSFVSKECGNLKDPSLILTGVNGKESYNQEFHLQKVKNNEDLSVLKYFWAKEKIDFLLLEEERCGQQCISSGRYRNEIIKLGEELNISTPYTSFISESYVNLDGNKGRKYSLYADADSHLIFQNDYDSDFDGVPNTIDECPFDKGLPERRGCPRTKDEKITEEVNLMIEGIEFDFDSFAIKEEFYERLDTAAEIIKSQEDANYIVEGHTDAAGTPEYNLELSLNRARAVINYLKDRGVDVTRLKIVGKGDTELKHPECRPQEICSDKKNFENRRVIFKLSNPQQ